MERVKDRTLKAYDYLAYYYDALLGDEEAFSYWLKEIEKDQFKSVLELASGSGVMAKILKDKGYEVIASDISLAMKEASKINFDSEYLIINMIDFDLNRKFDLVLCICDSINYLNIDELDSFFKSCYKHLNNGGRLIFDMHHLERLNEFKEEYVEEGDLEDIQYQWTINVDSFDRTINEHFTFYTPDGMIQEQHTQHVFDPNMIINKMKQIGFEVEYKEDFIKNEKVLFIGRKSL